MSRYDPAQPQFQQPATPQTVRQKSKAYASGIVAGVEDVKYQAKYKELKRKVKEIELDNDKLHYKVLHAKRNIQRMKLERAILYERLSMIPPSPELQGRPLPPAGLPPPPGHYGPPRPNIRDPHGHGPMIDPAEQAHSDPRHLGARLHDRGPLRSEEITIGPGMIPPPHALSGIGPRGPLHEQEAYRHLPPLPGMAAPQPAEPAAHGRAHSHSHPHVLANSHSSSPSDVGGHSSTSHIRAVPLAHSLSPPAGPSHPHSVQSAHSGQPPAPSVMSPSTSSRSGGHHHGGHGRIHDHQRIGPGVNINRAEWDRERDERERHREVLEREREWERERERGREREYERDREFRALREQELDRQRDMHAGIHRETMSGGRRIPTPPYASARHSMRDARDTPPQQDLVRAEHSLHGSISARNSRPDTPSSGSGNLIAESHSRPSSRPPQEYAGGRIPYSDSSRGVLDWRKSSRGDMEVDDEEGIQHHRMEGTDAGGYRSYSDDRGYRRHHQDPSAEANREPEDRDERMNPE